MLLMRILLKQISSNFFVLIFYNYNQFQSFGKKVKVSDFPYYEKQPFYLSNAQLIPILKFFEGSKKAFG
jgi:hypothetical protein